MKCFFLQLNYLEHCSSSTAIAFELRKIYRSLRIVHFSSHIHESWRIAIRQGNHAFFRDFWFYFPEVETLSIGEVLNLTYYSPNNCQQSVCNLCWGYCIQRLLTLCARERPISILFFLLRKYLIYSTESTTESVCVW